MKKKTEKVLKKSVLLRREITDDVWQKCTYANSRWEVEHAGKNGNQWAAGASNVSKTNHLNQEKAEDQPKIYL